MYHPVLRWLCNKRGNDSLFARQHDFYPQYKACYQQKICFGCRMEKMKFANTPCQCLLWCHVCSQEATVAAAAGLDHLCVICDETVDDINLKPDSEEDKTVDDTTLKPDSEEDKTGDDTTLKLESEKEKTVDDTTLKLDTEEEFPSLSSSIAQKRSKRSRR